ncbi:hypothetical protein Tco_0396601 [Tanacetum coccineum]
MIEEDFELAQRLTTEEQGELSIEERSKLFVELMNKRKQHFTKLRMEEIRRKPPTKAQKRNQMVTYFKNMAGYKHTQLKSKSFEEIQMLFENQINWIDSFVPMDSEVEGSKNADTEKESSTKRAAVDKLEEDLETLWKLVKAKHGDTRPEEDYERVLWGGSQSNERIVGFKRLHDDFEVSAAQEASTFEELKHRLSTIPVLSLPDFNKVVLTAMQRRLWDPVIKSAFQDDTLRASFNLRVEKRVWDLGLMKCLDQGYGISLVRNVEDMRQEGNGLFGFQDLCLRQELLEYMGVHDNDASESSQPSWGKMFTSGT